MRMTNLGRGTPCEAARTQLIEDIARVLREAQLPAEARQAALVLIGWLARRMPGEGASTVGVATMRHRMSWLCDRARAPSVPLVVHESHDPRSGP